MSDAIASLPARVVAAMLAGDRASSMLGMRVETVGTGRTRMSMTVRADMLNGHARCHGGFFDVEVRDQHDQLVALFRGKSSRIGGQVVAAADPPSPPRSRHE